MHLKAILLLLCTATLSQAAEPTAIGPRASYYKDGEIHITVLGQPETKAITTGHWDFKPSWSITGDHLVFFRRLKDDPEVNNWVTAMCIINTDGTGFHQLSDGTMTDFNPTWTRDGKNTPVWNRKVPGIVMSGYGKDEDIERSRTAGFAEHLTKPVEYVALRRAVARVAGA